MKHFIRFGEKMVDMVSLFSKMEIALLNTRNPQNLRSSEDPLENKPSFTTACQNSVNEAVSFLVASSV